MRALISLTGLILVILGIVMMYKGYTYTTQEKVAQIGNLQLVAEQNKTLFMSPFMGGVTLVTGIVLVLLGRIKK